MSLYLYEDYKRSSLGAVVEPNKAQNILLILQNRYPSLPQSCMLPTPAMPTGSCVPSVNEGADFYTFQALEVLPGQEPPGASVYTQLQNLAPGARALVDVNTLDKPGTPIVYMVAKNDQVAKTLAQSVNLQELKTAGSANQTEEKPGIKPAAIIGALVGGGIGFLVGGPVGAIVGGIGTGVLVQQVAA